MLGYQGRADCVGPKLRKHDVGVEVTQSLFRRRVFNCKNPGGADEEMDWVTGERTGMLRNARFIQEIKAILAA
ncbi:hypothetical protein D3C80_1742790 [compost metagenome]